MTDRPRCGGSGKLGYDSGCSGCKSGSSDGSRGRCGGKSGSSAGSEGMFGGSGNERVGAGAIIIGGSINAGITNTVITEAGDTVCNIYSEWCRHVHIEVHQSHQKHRAPPPVFHH